MRSISLLYPADLDVHFSFFFSFSPNRRINFLNRFPDIVGQRCIMHTWRTSLAPYVVAASILFAHQVKPGRSFYAPNIVLMIHTRGNCAFGTRQTTLVFILTVFFFPRINKKKNQTEPNTRICIPSSYAPPPFFLIYHTLRACIYVIHRNPVCHRRRPAEHKVYVNLRFLLRFLFYLEEGIGTRDDVAFLRNL